MQFSIYSDDVKDFDDKMELALFYKGKAEHYKTLFDEGIEHTVNF